MSAPARRKAVHAHLSTSTTVVVVEKHGLELLRGRERFFLDAREVGKLMLLLREGEG